MNHLNDFTSREALDLTLADNVAQQLQQAITKNGKASIAFSGGSTPKGFFKALSNKDIDWAKVTVTLADDRWLNEDQADSNGRLLKENLLVNNAAEASFFSLKQADALTEHYLTDLTSKAQSIMPLDVVILGMGEDGHTASIFPCSEQVEQGLDESAKPALMKTVPTTAPYDRVTFNFTALIEACHLYLHIVGPGKQHVLNEALENTNSKEMPIRAFLHHPSKTCEIYWAE